MKNCLPPLSRLEGLLAAATVPRAKGRSENSAATRPRPPASVLGGLARVLRQGVAALDDPALDDAVERRPVVAAGPRGLDEEGHVLRSHLGQQPDGERALRGLHDGLGAGGDRRLLRHGGPGRPGRRLRGRSLSEGHGRRQGQGEEDDRTAASSWPPPGASPIVAGRAVDPTATATPRPRKPRPALAATATPRPKATGSGGPGGLPRGSAVLAVGPAWDPGPPRSRRPRPRHGQRPRAAATATARGHGHATAESHASRRE